MIIKFLKVNIEKYQNECTNTIYSMLSIINNSNFNAYSKTNIQKSKQPEQEMSENFGTITIKHGKDNVLLANPVTYTNFVQNVAHVTRTKYGTHVKYHILSDIATNLKNNNYKKYTKTYNNTRIENTRISENSLDKIFYYSEHNKYLQENAKYTHIIVIIFSNNTDTDSNSENYKIAIPINTRISNTINDVKELEQLRKNVLLLDKFINKLHTYEIKTQQNILSKLEHYYSQIIEFYNRNKNKLNDTAESSTLSFVNSIRHLIEKRYFTIFQKKILYYNILKSFKC